MKTIINITTAQDGGKWYVYLVGKRIGTGTRTRRAAKERQAWLSSGVQDLIEAVGLMGDQAWKESGK